MLSKLFAKDGTKSVIASLISIFFGLVVGFIIILIFAPNEALEG